MFSQGEDFRFEIIRDKRGRDNESQWLFVISEVEITRVNCSLFLLIITQRFLCVAVLVFSCVGVFIRGVYHCLFLFSPSFAASGRLRFVIGTFSGYFHFNSDIGNGAWNKEYKLSISLVVAD